MQSGLKDAFLLEGQGYPSSVMSSEVQLGYPSSVMSSEV